MKTEKPGLLRRAIRSFFRAFLVLAAVLASLVLYLQTGHGRDLVARKASEALSRAPGRSVRIAGIGGKLPFDATLRGVSVSDRDGVWLDVRDVELRYVVERWRPFRARITRLAAGALEVSRRPARTGPPSAGFRMPSLPPIAIDELRVGRLALGPTILGRPLELEVAGNVTPGEIRLRATEPGEGPAGTVDATLVQQDGHLEFIAAATATSDAWWLRLARIPTGLVYRVDARARMAARVGESWPTGKVDLDLRIAGLDGTPAALPTLLGEHGTVRGEVSFVEGLVVQFTNFAIEAENGTVNVSGRAIVPDRRVELAWNVDAPDLARVQPALTGSVAAAGTFSIQAGAWEGQARGVYSVADLDAPFSSGFGGARGVVRLSNAQVRVDGISASGDLMIDTKTRRIAGAVRATTDDIRPVAERLGLALSGPADVRLSLDQAESGQGAVAQVRYRDVQVDASGVWNMDAISASARTSPIELKQLPWTSNFPGRVEGELRVEGAWAAPRIALRAAYTRDAQDRQPPVLAVLDAHASEGVATGQVSLVSGNLGEVRGDFAVPVTASLRPIQFARTQGAPMRGHVHGRAELGALNGWIMPKGHSVEGIVTADLQCGGEWPAIHGEGLARLDAGSYAFDLLGLAISDIQGELALRGGRLVLEQAGGRVGGGGRVNISGELAPTSDGSWGYRLDFESEKARFVRRDDARATVSGRLAITGGPGGARLSGDVVLDDVEILLDRMNPPVPTSLDVVNGERVTEKRVTTNGRKTVLKSGDVRIRLGDRFAVNGRGLESTWTGGLKLGYDVDGWTLAGRLAIKRGTYTLLSRPFRVTDGTVAFEGPMPPDPTLDITADYQRSDITAVAEVQGRAIDPQITLRSDPPMPEDEVLAYVLFGRSLSAISPLQGARLVLAAQELRGGRGPGLVTRTKELIPVDDIDIRESRTTPNSTEIVAGKSLSDRLYVEFNRVLGSGQSGIVAEYELTPHWSIETDAGPSLRPGFGVNWKVSY
jgi:autotransporter translocation and assembly factor TamB